MTTLKGVDDETEKGRKKWRICFIFPIHNFHNFSLFVLTRFDDRRRMRSTTTSSDDEEHEEDEADSPMVGVRMNNDNNNIRTKKKQQHEQSQSVRAGSGDEWNDSALVNAYNVAIKSYRNKKSLTASVKPKGKKGGGEYLAVPNADESQQEDEEKKLKKEKKKKTKKTKEDEEEVYREQQQHDGQSGYYEQEEGEYEHHHRANHGEYYYFQQPPRYPHYPPPRSPSDYYAYPQQYSPPPPPPHHHHPQQQHVPYYYPPPPGQYYSNPYDYASYTNDPAAKDEKSSRTRSGDERKTNDANGSNLFHPPDMRDSALRAAGNDEELANLLLAWYYAGYYTGQFRTNRRAPSIRESKKEDGGGKTIY